MGFKIGVPFKIPLDAWIVAVPMTYAVCAMTGLVIRVLSTDPEMSTLKRYEEESEEKLGQEAMAWNDGIASIFKDRIKAGKVSVFKNDFSKEVNAA